MPDEIKTHYVKGGFATSDEIVLNQSARTRTVFRPALHGGGVRGEIIRQKIGKDGQWKDTNEVNFNHVPADCGVCIELDTNATTTLFEKLTHLYKIQSKGIAYGDQKFVVAKEGEVLIIDDKTKHKAMQEILDKGYSEEFWASLAQKNPDLATRLAMGQVQADKQRIIIEFEGSIITQASNESYWQKFFTENPWLLEAGFSASVFVLGDETYLGGKQPVGRNGKGGVATDYLFGDESTKSFAVVDFKTPNSGLVGPIYRGVQGSGLENETYSMHKELSGGVVQVRNQITVAVEHFQSVLGAGYKDKINRVHPKGVLITGLFQSLDQRQRDSFNQFRHGLYSLTVITFDELLNRLKKLYGMEYENTANGIDSNIEVDDSEQPINLDDIPF
jgi:hypothetical protein